MEGHALALLELDSIARGLLAVDAMAKKAVVEIVEARSVSPGRYLIRLRGGVGEVEAAYLEGKAVAGSTLLDEVFLPSPHANLLSLLEGEPVGVEWDAVAIVECFTSASAVAALDAACKAAAVTATRLELANQLGGKGWFFLSGSLEDLDAALEAAAAATTPGMLQQIERVARPHADLGEHF
ncbi:MAG: BMC domain-containing protein [Deltaproteobacteria bacterium]|nr:BMC domain-containing protein [Deltaproteobacteria bacterium]